MAGPIVKREYRILAYGDPRDEEILDEVAQADLNEMAGYGWRFVGSFSGMMVLEKEEFALDEEAVRTLLSDVDVHGPGPTRPERPPPKPDKPVIKGGPPPAPTGNMLGQVLAWFQPKAATVLAPGILSATDEELVQEATQHIAAIETSIVKQQTAIYAALALIVLAWKLEGRSRQ